MQKGTMMIPISRGVSLPNAFDLAKRIFACHHKALFGDSFLHLLNTSKLEKYWEMFAHSITASDAEIKERMTLAIKMAQAPKDQLRINVSKNLIIQASIDAYMQPFILSGAFTKRRMEAYRAYLKAAAGYPSEKRVAEQLGAALKELSEMFQQRTVS
jgi:hypothetical protein